MTEALLNDPLLVLAACCLVMAAIPAWFYARNRSIYDVAGAAPASDDAAVSVLIPARNEAANIEACIRSVLDAADGVQVEVVALDDASDDDTAAIVGRLSAADNRVRLIEGVPLPAGWNGKQHACQRLADAASNETLLWIDADVRLEPGSLARMLGERERTGADLLSGFPRQVTVTPLERLLLPLIHFVLLGFLSLRAMRHSASPGFAAGCGQLFLTRRTAYKRVGGHGVIRASRHDGVTLPRAYRRAGLRTDLFDATDVACCRMYDGASAVWRGLAKNATEGVATPALIFPVSTMLLLGQVAPLPLLGYAVYLGATTPSWLFAVAAVLGYAQRIDAAVRFRQPLDGALAHPLGVLLFLFIQWEALGRDLLGKPVEWKGRGAAEAAAAVTDDDDFEDDWDDDLEDEDDEMPCPDCGAPVHVEAEACPSCGYWITDADRSAAWRAGSASGRIRRIGLWMIGLALLGALLAWLS